MPVSSHAIYEMTQFFLKVACGATFYAYRLGNNQEKEQK